MDEELDILLPVRFNPFKHHRNHILSILDGASPEVMVNLLDPVCNNNIDIYTGLLSPETIVSSIFSALKSDNVLSPDDLTRWLGSKTGYRLIRLEDLSEWIVRKSNDAERYIHIHPARSGQHTLRFKGSTLKTVYLLKTRKTDFREISLLDEVNQARMQIGLSPVKKLERNKGILNCLSYFDSTKYEQVVNRTRNLNQKS